MENYEEKYKDLVKRLNKAREEKGVYTFNSVLDAVAPELKINESEDEKIRKELLAWLKSRDWQMLPIDRYNAAIAWLEKQVEQKSMKTCAEYYNKDSELKMPELSVFQNKLADILMQREYEGSTETEEDVASARLDYELAAIRISEELLPLAIMQKPAELSEEDEYLLDETIKHLESLIRITKKQGSAYSDEIQYYQRDIDWLKSLKDRVQPKQQWSKEDERIKNNLLSELTNLSVRKLIEKETENKYVNWLKSLRPQSTWKPSEGQMVALKCAITTADEKWVCMNTKDLESLYEDLKKLKG